METIVISAAALVVSLANFIWTLVLTVRRDVRNVRPVLVFTYRSEGWHVENVGNGPALDLVFHRLAGTSPTQSVRLPALAKDSSVCLHFARHDSKQIFAATYRDVEGRKYASRSQHDISTSAKGWGIERPPDVEALVRWWQLPDSGR